MLSIVLSSIRDSNVESVFMSYLHHEALIEVSYNDTYNDLVVLNITNITCGDLQVKYIPLINKYQIS